MRRILSAYPNLMRAFFALAVEYRFQIVMWLMSGTYPIVTMLVWITIAQRNGGSAGGLSVSNFVGYYMGVALMRRITYIWILNDFEEDIRSGTLSTYLLRPLHYMHFRFAQIVAVRFLNAIIAGAIVAIVVLIVPGRQFDLAPLNLLLFCAATATGFLIEFFVQAIAGCLAFWTTQVYRIFDSFWFVKSLLGGFVVPVTLLPAPVRDVTRWLPFQTSMGLPVDILTGRASVAHAVEGILVGLAWAGVLLFAARWVWMRGTRGYSAVGA